MIDGILLLWFLLTLGSFIFVLWDQLTNTPSMRVMTLAWLLMILYTGPLGLFIYFLSCRQPLPGTHDEFIKDHWKQAVGSLLHCVAGDATAIIVMAAILHYFSPPNGIEVILEYTAAYLFGLFIFQALFMKEMFKSYSKAVKETIFPETVSMNFVMLGMFPVIVFCKSQFPESSDPTQPYFWAMMSLATIVGSFISYPVNSWMVRKNIKHGMMSKPHKEQKHAHHHGAHGQHHEQTMTHHKVPSKQMWGLILGSYALFIAVMWVTSFFVPIRFTY